MAEFAPQTIGLLLVTFILCILYLQSTSIRETDKEILYQNNEELQRKVRNTHVGNNELRRKITDLQNVERQLTTFLREREIFLSEVETNSQTIDFTLSLKTKLVDDMLATENKDKHSLDELKKFTNSLPSLSLPPLSPIRLGWEDTEKKQEVKKAFLRAWNGYKMYAWGKDELLPLSQSGDNSFADLGATIVDSLDTLWIMNLIGEFQEARDWVESSLSFDKNIGVSVFETTIRILGGLLSAYEFSGDRIFLEKAEDLGTRLLRSFNPASPFPSSRVNLATGAREDYFWARGKVILSEIGTLQLEFLNLAYHTRNFSYAKNVLEVFKKLDEIPKDSTTGLYPVYLTSSSPAFIGREISIGGLGDSFYEYLLKVWIFSGRRIEGYRRMYSDSVDNIAKHLVITTNSGYRYIADIHNNGALLYRMQHLTCFAGGMLGLGAHNTVKLNSHQIESELELAADITESCHQSYIRTNTHIGPEFFAFYEDEEFVPAGPHYLLRPETVESYFVMWRLTHEQKYRDWAWDFFLALEKHCRISTGGYAGLQHVDFDASLDEEGRGNNDDRQQSFFLAETLKYLYLIFCDDDVISLDSYVFNTEAHPVTIKHDLFSVLPDVASHIVQR